VPRVRLPRLRQRRRAAAPDQPPTALPTVLVMTMVRDEAEMLPRWVAHYAAQVGMDNLVVLDDNSTDGSTDELDCTVHRLPPLRGGRYERTRMQLLSGLAQGFLAAYDYVVFVDADEFLVPDPARYADLPTFLAHRSDRDVVAPTALNVVHVPSVEGPLRAGEPVLGQRRYAVFAPIMCKPSIKRVPAGWRWASHGIEAPFEVDPELFMVHLKFYDREALRRVATHRRRMVDTDGRAAKSNWSRDAEEMVAMLEEFVGGSDPGAVPEFDPRQVDLSTIVQPKGDAFRAVGQGQVQAMAKVPLWRVPDRLLGRL
jgi:hypothetical protein